MQKNKSVSIIVCQNIRADRAAGDSVEIYCLTLSLSLSSPSQTFEMESETYVVQ